jgi:hypothetical protein
MDTHRDEGRVKYDLRAAAEHVDGGVVDAREALDGLLHRPRALGARHSDHLEHRHLLLLLLRSPLRGLQVAAASSRVAGDHGRSRAPRHRRVPRPQREVAAHLGTAAVEAGEERGFEVDGRGRQR